MIVVGLTGGIASGKTTVVKFLKKKRLAIHDSDFVVKKIYSKPEEKFLKALKQIGLEKSIIGKKISKKIIREEIFNNKEKKEKLEKFIHKEVRASRRAFIQKHTKKKTKIVILDIPLLFEKKLTSICDYIILLTLPNKKRIARALKRKGMKKDILLKIIDSQLKDSIKKKKANFVINTSRAKNHSFDMILKAINIIIKKNA